jgi:hypothetical protein
VNRGAIPMGDFESLIFIEDLYVTAGEVLESLCLILNFLMHTRFSP